MEAHTGSSSPSTLNKVPWGVVLDAPIDVNDFVKQVVWVWRKTRAVVIVPMLWVAVYFCLFLTVLILVEKLFVGAVSLAVKIFRLKPEKRYRWEPMELDVEMGNLSFPMVLVQIPMYNEKEVYKLAIRAACRLEWPSDRKIIQVLDDSTDPELKDSVKLECQIWGRNGVNIKYEVRDNRMGYKAGALKEGMMYDYVKECDYSAMFDADFQPEPDFLMRTIPFLIHNPKVALVQSRWKFVNADECMMTRIQEMSLDYHFKIEQEAGSSTFSFFGFNGTAGVWRISAIEEAGGWKDRTTVEDMDLAVRAGLVGWKFIYVGNIKVKSELPSTFKAYRHQQHRWSCGPANLFKKTVMEIIKNKKVTILKKIYLIYSFFFVGKIVAQTVTFIFYCFVIPISIFFPEVVIPRWGLLYVPVIITICKLFGTPRSIHLAIIWVLFENVMSLHRLKAASTGIFEIGRVNEWIVTEKLGDSHKMKPSINEAKDTKILHRSQGAKMSIDKHKRICTKIFQRLYFSELGMGFFLLLCGCYDVAYHMKGYFVYLFLQSLAFFITGFGFVGTYIHGS